MLTKELLHTSNIAEGKCLDIFYPLPLLLLSLFSILIRDTIYVRFAHCNIFYK